MSEENTNPNSPEKTRKKLSLNFVNSEKKQKLNNFYDKRYKLLLFIPIILLVLCLAYLFIFYQNNGDIIQRDISLTGGTSIQVNSNISISDLEVQLKQNFDKVSIRQVSDIFTGEQLAFIIETDAPTEEIVPFLENYLGYSLDSENSSIEFTGSVLGQGFYIQVLLAILFSFMFMGTVVFFIFSDNKKLKYLLILLVIITPTLFFFLKVISITTAFILSIIILIILIGLSIRYSIPAAAVIFAAFTDIVMTLTIVNLLGIQVSSAGIIAFLMLIGYSVDTDILLTTRVLKKKEGTVNSRIFGAFKTGITMALTSLAVVIIGFLITSPLSEVLKQIFTILSIGLFFDIVNTWATNASMIKWYLEAKK